MGKILVELETDGINERVGLHVAQNNGTGSVFSIPNTIHPKSGTYKTVVDN